ncbi:hypothetical protein [Brevundimonas olei]|uniref:hypothetical protein n=1 Tax=Brevundimonas olei TaxID=657642 RepID=UPI0031E17FEB
MADGVVPIEVDELAKLLHQKSQGEDAQWRGRRTNRAYYRRLAKAELARRATPSDKEVGA